MNKIIGVLVIAAVGYFFFMKDSAPDAVYINGQEYSSKALDKSNDSNSKIYNYKSKTVENHDYVSILYPDEGTGSLESWSSLFSSHFTSQGFVFRKIGDSRVGTKNKVKVYLVPLYAPNLLAIYVLENTDKPGIPMGKEAIDVIRNIQLK